MSLATTSDQPAKGSGPVLPAELAQKPGADILSRPVVLNWKIWPSSSLPSNSNDDTVNSELIQLLTNTIFEGCPDLAEWVLSRIDFQRLSSIAAAEEAVTALVVDAIHRKHPDAERLGSALEAHLARRDANRRAYSPAGRIKPSAVFWPNPDNSDDPRSLRTELPFVRSIPVIDRSTPIVSMGSCFAMEIAHVLQQEGFNYVVKEGNKAVDGTYWLKDREDDPYSASSAAWGILFNCPSFLQVIEKAFGYRRPAKILWTNLSNGKLVYCDPFREELEFPSVEAFEANYQRHIDATRAALMEARVLIITLGLNEVWYFKPDGSVFSRSPWRTAPSLVEHKVLTVQENVRDLQSMLDILRAHNPDVKLIVTLSPIPLHATFLADTSHIVEANAHSKAVLRVAADEFVRANSEVYYFPSFELITTCLLNPWDSDERHVTAEAVDRVMDMFKKMFC